MTFEIRTEPLDRWPLPETPPSQRRSIQFTAPYQATLRLLRGELEHLGASGTVVIQVVTRNGAADVRRDGLLRAAAKIEHRGVRVSFESRHGPLTYSTDVYEARRGLRTVSDWQANLRAVALSLEALRAVDRYGVSRSGEQYRGWQAIEGTAGGVSTVSRAIALIADVAGIDVESDDDLHRAARKASARTHPDLGGARAQWDRIQAAKRLLVANGRLR